MNLGTENLTHVNGRSRASAWWLVVVVAGILATQAVTRSLSIDGKPGVDRDDAVFVAEVLPNKIVEWEFQQFFPAVNADSSIAGQFWTTHAWEYGVRDHSCVVAFDQLGRHEGHELTVCYEGRGWNISERVIALPDEGNDWPYVVARMSNPDGRHGLVVFSVFWGSGEPMAVPSNRLAVSFTGRTGAPGGLFSRLTDRVQNPEPTNVRPGLETRGLQCQAFLTSIDVLSSQQVESVVALHRATREQFRTAWLAHAVMTH